jgi:hypothetical protein
MFIEDCKAIKEWGVESGKRFIEGLPALELILPSSRNEPDHQAARESQPVNS